MRMTHDREADAAYIYLVDEVAPGEVTQTRVADVPLDRAAIAVDFDADGRIIGLEILGANRVLRSSTIAAASDITRQ
ncbi:DUF2283 domain-containing protein [Nocardioides ultimimeridianus]